MAAHVPFNNFVGISSADGYKTMLSHLGPDKKVFPFAHVVENNLTLK